MIRHDRISLPTHQTVHIDFSILLAELSLVYMTFSCCASGLYKWGRWSLFGKHVHDVQPMLLCDSWILPEYMPYTVGVMQYHCMEFSPIDLCIEQGTDFSINISKVICACACVVMHVYFRVDDCEISDPMSWFNTRDFFLEFHFFIPSMCYILFPNLMETLLYCTSLRELRLMWHLSLGE